jgi:hypothetical protein
MDDSNVLYEATGKSDGARHADDSNSECNAGNGDILAVGEGDDVLPVDDNSSALCVVGDSDVSSSGDNATVPVIGAIGAGNNHSTGDVLATIGSSGGSVVISGSGANLGADTLRVGDNDSILDVGDLSTGGRCSSDSSDALATGKGGDILRASNNIIPTVGIDILGTGSGGGPNHVVFHDLPAPGAFTTAAPPLYAHKESR